MRHLWLLIRYLTNIVQQTRTFCFLWIQTQLTGHNSTKISSLTSVLQQVLPIAATILHFTNDTNQLWMQAMNTKVDGCTLTRFNNLLVDLLLHLSHNFLYTGWMYTTVGYQLMQSQTANFTSYWVKSTNNNSFRGIINHNFNTCSSF